MKNLYFLLLLLSTTSFAQQNSQDFSPHLEIGLQYNSEWNSAIGEAHTSNLIDRKFGWGNSWAISVSYQFSKRWMLKTYFNYAHRNFKTTTISQSNNRPSVSKTLQTIYIAKEYAVGINWLPLSTNRLFFSTGLGLSEFSKTLLQLDSQNQFLSYPSSYEDPSNGLFGNNRLFIFFEAYFIFFKSKNIKCFLIPHFKMNFNTRNVNHLQEQYYNFGLGIGGSIKIGN